MTDAKPDRPFRILVVCTANICRSVMAERFLRRELAERSLNEVVVESCGMLFDDEPASDTVLAVLAERGIDASDHRSRIWSTEMIDRSDLVVTMERRHARELSVAHEGASPRIHTLGAIVACLAADDHRVGTPEERIASVSVDREASVLLGSGVDEVDDPHGRSKRVHRRSADQIEALVGGLLDGLFAAPSGAEAD